MSFFRLIICLYVLIMIVSSQIIDQMIQLDQQPLSDTNEIKNIGMRAFFEIKTQELKIVITMINNVGSWMGVGFGGLNMENRYAVTWELDPNTNTMGLYERTLGKDNKGTIINKPDSSSVTVKEREGEQLVQYTRDYFQFFPASDPVGGGQPGGWTLNADDKQLEYILANGNTPDIQYHGDTNRLANTVKLEHPPPPPPKSVPIVCRNDTTGCKDRIVSCKANEDCIIRCGLGGNDPRGCYNSTILCPSDYNCDVSCNGYQSCMYMKIHSEDSNILYVNGCVNGSNTCGHMNIYCPERWENIENRVGRYHCIIDGGDNGLYDVNIYNIMGFRSMKYINYEGNLPSMGSMHCGLEYPNKCDIDNLSDIPQCLRSDDSTDISCDDPPLSYFYCIGAQDPNGGGNCLQQLIECKEGLDCYVYCGRNEFDKYSCAQSKVVCPKDKKCVLFK